MYIAIVCKGEVGMTCQVEPLVGEHLNQVVNLVAAFGPSNKVIQRWEDRKSQPEDVADVICDALFMIVSQLDGSCVYVSSDVRPFLASIIRRARLCPSVLLCALVYIQRFVKASNNHKACGSFQWTPQRLFVAATILACKFLNDECYNSHGWSKLSNFPVGDIKTLEYKFACTIDFDLFVAPEELPLGIEERLPSSMTSG
eukprot:Colp12_sorted_trinity150504_noHs@8374